MMGKDNKTKIIPTLKDSSTTASSDQEKADMFVNNLENIFCKNDPVNKYNDNFKNEVEQFTILNDHLYQPISTNNLGPPTTSISNPLFQKISIKEIDEEINKLSIKKLERMTTSVTK